MKNAQPILDSPGTHAIRVARLALFLCASLQGPAALAGDPGCPPSFCSLADDPTGVLTNRLTLFPGTSSVVHDNGPNDENPICGVLEVTARPFPLAWVTSGSALFTGRIGLVPPTNSVPGRLIVTFAEILSTGDPSGGPPVDFVPQELPLGCAAFFVPEDWGPPSGMNTSVVGEWDTDAAGAGMLVGGESWTVTSVATTLDVTIPTPDPAPSEVVVQVFGPSVPSPAPSFVGFNRWVYGTYAEGEGVIGLKVDGVLPTGESLNLPNSIVTTFGELHPPAIADGTAGSEPMKVAKLDPQGTALSVSWDTASCEGDATGIKLIYGGELPSPGEDSYLPTGAVCGIGAAESPFTWDDPPTAEDGQPLLWWLVVAEDGIGQEGSWGSDSSGVERNGPGADGSSLTCGVEFKDLVNGCGQSSNLN